MNYRVDLTTTYHDSIVVDAETPEAAERLARLVLPISGFSECVTVEVIPADEGARAELSARRAEMAWHRGEHEE